MWPWRIWKWNSVKLNLSEGTWILGNMYARFLLLKSCIFSVPDTRVSVWTLISSANMAPNVMWYIKPLFHCQDRGIKITISTKKIDFILYLYYKIHFLIQVSLIQILHFNYFWISFRGAFYPYWAQELVWSGELVWNVRSRRTLYVGASGAAGIGASSVSHGWSDLPEKLSISGGSWCWSWPVYGKVYHGRTGMQLTWLN